MHRAKASLGGVFVYQHLEAGVKYAYQLLPLMLANTT